MQGQDLTMDQKCFLTHLKFATHSHLLSRYIACAIQTASIHKLRQKQKHFIFGLCHLLSFCRKHDKKVEVNFHTVLTSKLGGNCSASDFGRLYHHRKMTFTSPLALMLNGFSNHSSYGGPEQWYSTFFFAYPQV
jgi:hypothetical protein